MSEKEQIDLQKIHQEILKDPMKIRMLDPKVVRKINDEIEARDIFNEGTEEPELKEWQKLLMT